MRKITFIHISDVLLGAEPDWKDTWSGDRKKEIYNTFEAVVEKACELGVDFLLIAGNLFDHQPTAEELSWLDDKLGILKHTDVIYSAGFFDHLGNDAPLMNYRFKSPVYVIGSTGLGQTAGENAVGVRDAHATMALDHLHFRDKNSDIYGVSYFDKKMDARVVDEAVPVDMTVNNLLIACGGDKRRLPVDWSRLRSSGFAYAAFGGLQKYQIKLQNMAYYPGSPEAVSGESVGAHGYIYGELIDGSVKVRFVKASAREYKRVDYPVDDQTRDVDLAEAVRDIMATEGQENIYTISLNRTGNCEKNFDIAPMLTEYKILDIEGERFDRTDYSDYLKANKNTRFGMLLDKMDMADMDARDGLKLAVDTMIEVSGLYARQSKKMSHDMYSESMKQTRSILEARRSAYEADDSVQEYRRLRKDYEVSPDVLDELNQVWAQERRTELEITTERKKIEELPRKYRRSRMRTVIRKGLLPSILLGLLAVIMFAALFIQSGRTVPSGSVIYAGALTVLLVLLICCVGCVLVGFRWRGSGGEKKKLNDELAKEQMRLDVLCAKRDGLHSDRVKLQTLDGRRRDIYERLTQHEKMLDEKLQSIKVMSCAIDELDDLRLR